MRCRKQREGMRLDEDKRTEMNQKPQPAYHGARAENRASISP